MEIYIDVVMIENCIINFLILYTEKLITYSKTSNLRIAISSLIGATYTILCYTRLSVILSNVVAKFLISICIIYIAFKTKGIKNFAKKLLLFYLISFIFGGIAFAILFLISPNELTICNGQIKGNYSIAVIIVASIVSFLLTINVFRNNKSKIENKDLVCKLVVNFNNIKFNTKAFIDTGNTLVDPYSNGNVIVIEKNLIDFEEVIKGGDYETKIRLIPFNTIGKENGVMIGIKCDRATVIKNDGARINLRDITLGLYDKKISNNYSALIGINMLNNGIES